MPNLKPSTYAVLIYLRRRGWVTTRDVIRGCPTDTPSKRLSELFKEGLIEKRRSEIDPHRVEYRAKEAN